MYCFQGFDSSQVLVEESTHVFTFTLDFFIKTINSFILIRVILALVVRLETNNLIKQVPNSHCLCFDLHLVHKFKLFISLVKKFSDRKSFMVPVGNTRFDQIQSLFEF